eukprot:101631-Amphidinium_carterae.1
MQRQQTQISAFVSETLTTCDKLAQLSSKRLWSTCKNTHVGTSRPCLIWKFEGTKKLLELTQSMECKNVRLKICLTLFVFVLCFLLFWGTFGAGSDVSRFQSLLSC